MSTRHREQHASRRAGATDVVYALLNTWGRAEDYDGQPLTLGIGLVQGLSVGGVALPLDAQVEATGTTPVVSWTAPAAGTPATYRVRIQCLTDEVTQSGSTQASRTVATLVTTGTSVTIPEGTLEAGQWYALAIDASTDDLGLGWSQESAGVASTMWSGVFTP